MPSLQLHIDIAPRGVDPIPAPDQVVVQPGGRNRGKNNCQRSN